MFSFVETVLKDFILNMSIWTSDFNRDFMGHIMSLCKLDNILFISLWLFGKQKKYIIVYAQSIKHVKH